MQHRSQATGQTALAPNVAEDRLPQMVRRPMLGGAVANQRGSQPCGVKLFRAVRALAEVLAENLALLCAHAIVQQIFESLSRFVTRHGESSAFGAGTTTPDGVM